MARRTRGGAETKTEFVNRIGAKSTRISLPGGRSSEKLPVLSRENQDDEPSQRHQEIRLAPIVGNLKVQP
jgi:hypothetical protein